MKQTAEINRTTEKLYYVYAYPDFAEQGKIKHWGTLQPLNVDLSATEIRAIWATNLKDALQSFNRVMAARIPSARYAMIDIAPTISDYHITHTGAMISKAGRYISSVIGSELFGKVVYIGFGLIFLSFAIFNLIKF